VCSSTTEEDYIPTKRHRTAMELLQTETSYLRSLNTIIQVFIYVLLIIFLPIYTSQVRDRWCKGSRFARHFT